MTRQYDFVLFDLLTALLDSWTLWNSVAGGEEAGRAWRAAYLRRTYACGAYRPYETLVREAALETGLPGGVAQALEARWSELAPWEGVAGMLRALRATHRLGVVTNCSERLGRLAAGRLGMPLDVIVTSERAGYYKPDPRPYRLALAELGAEPARTLFVAGSGYDLFGTSAVGMDAYWHNRAGLALPAGAPAPLREARTLDGLAQLAGAPPAGPR
ncbi:HAD-IA family hydrolase [Achromobacter sp. Marseille-Q4962]|jgi:2-haloalkanoic acid dehalogenase type II|uniref:HAD family hydrolase n=1 Tax=Achromobacter sp. Marseille-Q4962 TaxID=2942202 RepID=UPI002073E286|nr:HAD-IA family hydrolase [Achromobacter sp. Marseille-Q4962]